MPVQEALWWHPVHTQGAAHRWLRETAARVAATLTGRGSAAPETSAPAPATNLLQMVEAPPGRMCR